MNFIYIWYLVRQVQVCMERAQGWLSGSCWAKGLCWVESCSQVSAQVGLRGEPSCAHPLQTTECPSLPQPSSPGGSWPGSGMTTCWSLWEE